MLRFSVARSEHAFVRVQTRTAHGIDLESRAGPPPRITAPSATIATAIASVDLPELPAALIGKLRSARSVVALTGGGLAAESGVPSLSAARTGMWAGFDPLELATPAAFARNPKLVWDWYAWRRELLADVLPNAGHVALADLARHVPGCLVVTLNVDGLHQRAGTTNIVELHGNLRRARCSRDGTPAASWDDSSPRLAPACAGCGAPLRPDVVWFEESIGDDVVGAVERAARGCDVLLVVGTAAEAYPAALLPAYAHHHGATVVEINARPTRLTPRVDVVLRGSAADVLPALLRAAFG
jgi:NAD-dependent deacetylase